MISHHILSSCDEGGLFLPPAYPFLSELATAGFVRVQRAKHWQGSVVMITAAGRMFVEGGAATDAAEAEA